MYYITILKNSGALSGKFSVTQLFYSWMFIQEKLFHMYQKETKSLWSLSLSYAHLEIFPMFIKSRMD